MATWTKMDSRSFYHSDLDGPAAEELLTRTGEGSFLLRPSNSSPGWYTLSVRKNSSVTHIRIQNTGSYYDLQGGERFATLLDLVQNCIKYPETLREQSGDVIRLKKPVYSKSPTAERYFHGILRGKTAEEMLLNKNVKDGTYLLRWSCTHPGNMALSFKVNDQVKHVEVSLQNDKYIVREHQPFRTIPDLISYFSSQGLQQPMKKTAFCASDIKKRIEQLERKIGNKQPEQSGFQEEFEMLHRLDSTNMYSQTEGYKEHNRPKNRYKNIIPFDYTRVVLKGSSDDTDDYINASYLTMTMIDELLSTELKKLFIATQGCLVNTIGDFWKMIWQENCCVIVMITKAVERGKKKCAGYWPDDKNPKIFNLGDDVLAAELKKQTDYQHYKLREITVKLQNAQGEIKKRRSVYHFQFTTWPDKDVPQTSGPTLDFLCNIDNKQKHISDAGPVVVHCSAGIGRTGTFIIIDTILAIIDKFGVDTEIDIFTLVRTARAQRSGMVQTSAQYKFIYETVALYVESKLKANCDNQYENAGFVSEKQESQEERSLYQNV